ncbi:MAG: dTDP-glucose 4,6-dehydratase [Planctomycetota bacterium]|jgi:dTDP-glucose 4,6-dehydratase|nr:dTDP-glucose 4,6-dehydratase [Planctomycetota bacterium]
MKILVTGGAGFIGSNFVLWMRSERPDVEIVNLDLLTYAGNLENLKSLESDSGHIFVKADVADREALERVFNEHSFAGVVHFAAESHVDRSILDATPFVRNNILGTQVLLDLARAHSVPRFLQVSTDEVYGALGKTGLFTEETPLAPNSPYAASKASADMLVRAAFKTHGYNAVITRCSNNYGALQFPEKLIPLMIANAVEGKPLPVYGDGMQIRDWLHVSDHCSAIWTVFEQAAAGAIYNIGGNNEWANIDVVKLLLSILGKSEDLIEYVEDRAGHDRRYAIDASRIKADLGWEPRRRFEEALPETVAWYLEHQGWWERVRSGAYREYYATQYGGRIGV